MTPVRPAPYQPPDADAGDAQAGIGAGDKEQGMVKEAVGTNAV